MSTLRTTSEKLQQLDKVTFDQNQAAAFAGVSAKSLERLAAAGEPVGRLKVGRRVLYLRAALERWLESKTATPSA